jgi:8-oxo-dGTP pyrophosphatase MutT (NUDIX family)
MPQDVAEHEQVPPVPNKKVLLGAMGLAVNDKKQVLLTQRFQPSTPAWHLKWNIPGGGIEFGEDPEAALIREFWEELRVKPTLRHPLPIPVNIVWMGDRTGQPYDFHLMMLCYVVDIGDQKIDITQDVEHETCDYKWFTLEEAKKIETLPHTVETIERALALVA